MRRITPFGITLLLFLPFSVHAQLSAPTGFTATVDSCWGVLLSWDPMPLADSFAVSNGVDTWFTADTLYRDSAAVAGPTSYTVAGIDTNGVAGATANAAGFRRSTPDVPAGLTASNDRCDGVFLAWFDVQDEDGYYIYRDGVPVDTLLPNAASWLDGGAPAGVQLQYGIAAFNVCAPNPTPSTAVSGFRNLAPPDAVSGLSATTGKCAGVELSWPDVAREDGYVIERSGVIIDTNGADQTLYVDTTASPGSSYTYRVGPINSCTTAPVWGGVSALGTRPPAAPVQPASPAASDTSCTIVRLDWGGSANAAGYEVARGGIVVDTVPSDTLFLEDLLPPGTYSYSVTAFNTCGRSTPATTSGTVLPPPAPPAGLVASTDSCGMIRIDWTPAVHDTAWYVYRGTLLLGEVDVPYFQDLTAPVGSSTYHVGTLNRCGRSDSLSVPGIRPPDAPPSPAPLAASDTSCALVRLDWSGSANAAGYEIVRDGVPVDSVPAGTLFYEDAPGPGTYAYSITAFNPCGRSSPAAASGTVLPGAPASPAPLAASDTSCTLVRLDWSGSANVAGYEIVRDGVPVDSVPAGTLFYEDTPGPGTYSYSVTAFNPCGRSSPAAAGVVVLPPPAPPSGLSASADSCALIRLDWTAAASDTTWYVYRDATFLGVVTVPFYRDLAAPAGTFTYWVGSLGPCGRSDSLSVTGTKPPAAPDPPAVFVASDGLCGVVQLSWNPPARADSFYVYRNGGKIAAVTDTFFNDPTGGGGWLYAVDARNTCGISTATADSGSALPGTPEVPVITASTNRCDGIELKWSDVADEEGYYLFRDALPLDTLGAGNVAYIDTGVTPGVTYAYRLSAFNGCAPSPVLSGPANGSRLFPPPDPVSGLTTTNDRCDGIALTWLNVAGEDGFAIERDGLTIDTVAADILSYVDSSALPGTLHGYRVGAFNGCSVQAAWSASGSGERPPGTPGAPTGVTASDDSCGLIRVDFIPVATATSHRIFRDSVLLVELTAPVSTFRDTTAGPGPASFLYEVSALNSCGESPRAADTGSIPPPPPAAPTASATSDRCDGVEVTWTDVVGETGFIIYRDGVVVDSVPADTLRWFDTGAVPGVSALYAVAGWNSCAANPVQSSPVSGLQLFPPPTAPAGLAASDRLCASITLNWADATGEDHYAIERDSVVIATLSADAVSYQDLSAQPGSTYSYRVGPYNACSVTPVFGDAVIGRRLPGPPDTPGSVTASDDSCGIVRVEWLDAAEADSFIVTRDNARSYAVPAGLPSYVFRDSLGPDGATATYKVFAWNDCGLSVAGEDPGTRPPDPPGRPAMVSASGDSCDGILLTWTDVEREQGYYIWRDGVVADTLIPGTVTWFDADPVVAPGTAHTYYVGAFNECATAVLSDTVEGFRMIAPPPIDSLSASTDSCGGIILKWNDVAYEDGYSIKRNGVDYVTVGPGTVTYVDSADFVMPGTDYTYQVGPFNHCSGGPDFGVLTAIGRRPWPIPDPPAGVTASDDECPRVVIDWNASDHAQFYTIYRDGVGIGEMRDTTNATPSFIDWNPPTGSYTYGVTAGNSCGISAIVTDRGTRRSGPGKPENPAATNDRCDGVLVTWDEAVGAESYTVRRNGIIVAGNISFSVFQYLDSGVPGGSQNSYTVEAVNPCGIAVSASVIGMRASGAPTPPTNVSATDDLCDRVEITWSYTGSTADLIEFRISVRDSGGGAAFDSVGTVGIGENSFVHYPPAGSYEYLVSSVNQCGLSPETGSTAFGERRGVPETPAFNASSDTAVCAGQTITLRWDPVDQATSYTISEGSNHYSTTAASFSTTRAAAKTYHFTIRADGACGASASSEPFPVKVYSSAKPPSGVAATTDSCGAIYLSWTRGATSSVWIAPDGGDTLFFPSETSWIDPLPEGGSVVYHFGGYNLCDTISSATTVTGYAWPLSIDPPVDMQATDGLCDSVVITWGFTGNLDGIRTFRLLRYDGVVATPIAVVGKDDPFRVVDFPPDAESHRYVVQSENDCALSLAAEDDGSATKKPAVPVWMSTGVSACVSQTFTLQWQPVAGASLYRVFRNGESWITTTRSNTLVSLGDPGVQRFTVRGENGCGAGGLGEELIVVIAEDPVDPIGVALDTSLCDTVQITWTAQQESVTVMRSDRVVPVWVGPGTGSAIDIPEKAATYTVRTFNGCGESEGVVLTLGTPKRRPAPPEAVNASNLFCDSVVVTWSLPQTDAAVDYLVVTRTRDGVTETPADSLDISTRRFVDRSGSGEYEYAVLAVNECGMSVADDDARDGGAFIPSTGKGAFLADSDTAGCIGTPIVLRWEKVQGAIFYRIREAGEVVAVVDGSRDSTTLSSPSAAARIFRIQALGACGEGEESDPWIVNVGAQPMAPVRFDASDDRCGEVRLTWAAPQAPIDGVRLFRGGGEIGWAAWPETTFSDTQAVPGENYLYTASALGRCGESGRTPSAGGFRIPGLAPPVQVGPPEEAGGLPIPVSFSWEEVDNATGYRLQVRLDSSLAPVIDTTLPPAMSAVVSRLEPGVPYQWRVAALSDCGSGDMSAWRRFGTIAGAPALLESDPVNFAVHVPLDVVIRVTFSTPIDPASLGGAILMSGGESIPGTAALESGGSVLLFAPDAPLVYNETYVLLVSGLRDVYGRPLGGVAPVTFTTVPGAKPEGDLDDDFQRTPSDVTFALSVLVGERDPASIDTTFADMNGDGRFTVADLVALATLIVREGTILIPGDGKVETAEITVRVERTAPGAQRLRIGVDLPYAIRSGFVEVVIPEGVESVDGVKIASDGGESWFALTGDRLRILTAGPGAKLSFTAVLHGNDPLRYLKIPSISCADEEGVLHRIVSRTGDTVPVGPAAAALLLPNRPNPFNPETTVRFFTPLGGRVRLVIYDLSGRLVAVLHDGALAAGWHEMPWDGTTVTGDAASSGIYFARLEEDDGVVQTIRMVLLR